MTTNKQDVRRYTDMGSETICPINNMRESDDGNYVLYEDYEAVQAENDRLRAKLAAMEGQEPVAWGAFYFGGKHRGQLYSHTLSEEQIEDYIAYVHRSNDSITLRKGPLYVKPVPSDLEIVQKALRKGEVLTCWYDKTWCVESSSRDNASGHDIESLLTWAKQQIGVE